MNLIQANAAGSNTTTDAIAKQEKNQSESELEFWTTEALIDGLSLCLVKVKEVVTNKENYDRQLTIRKYFKQARDLMKWIPIAKPSPSFVLQIC